MSLERWGTLCEPTIPAPAADEPSRVDARARRASPAGTNEDLGAYGSERWELPGYGESGPKCGVWYPDSVCDEHGHVDMNAHRCGRRTCPDCWAIWAEKAGVRATVRTQAFRYTQPDDYHRQAAHAVVTPEEGDVMNEREFYDGKSKAAEIAKEKGFRGFSVIAHPWRVTSDAKSEYRDADHDVGIWVWLRNEFSEAEMRERTYWSPHYHIVGITSRDMSPGDESDEMLYRFIRSLESFDGTRDEESHEDVYGTYRYLLSHTGYPEGATNQAVTWYGDLANAVFVEDATEDYQIEKPSEGVRDVMQRCVESLAGVTLEEDGDGGCGDGDEDDDVCPRDGCGGELIDVFDVSMYLRHNQPPDDVAERMRVARDWRLGDVDPPPGLKRPTTQEDAHDAFEKMMGSRSA